MITHIKTKIIITIALLLISFLSFLTYPVYGLFICCISTFVLCRLYINFKNHIKYSLTVVLVASTYVSLVGKATEQQGQKLVCELIAYYSANKLLPINLNETNSLLLNSFTPTFSKYQYYNTYDSTGTFLFHIKYKDLWGKEYKYCDKCGEFECKKNSTRRN